MYFSNKERWKRPSSWGVTPEFLKTLETVSKKGTYTLYLRRSHYFVNPCLTFSPPRMTSVPLSKQVNFCIYCSSCKSDTTELWTALPRLVWHIWTAKSDDNQDKCVPMYLSCSTTLMFQIFATGQWVL